MYNSLIFMLPDILYVFYQLWFLPISIHPFNSTKPSSSRYIIVNLINIDKVSKCLLRLTCLQGDFRITVACSSENYGQEKRLDPQPPSPESV